MGGEEEFRGGAGGGGGMNSFYKNTERGDGDEAGSRPAGRVTWQCEEPFLGRVWRP